MVFLKALAVIFFGAGAGLVFGSRWIVNNYKLNEKVTAEYASQMTEEELERYKMNKAVVNVKMIGMLVAMPGIGLLLYAFR